jgi:MFS-type transporter involved in bile tolerance (Atg22 family)
MVGGLTLWSGSQRVGMGTVAVELLIGLLIILPVPRDKE